MEEKVKINFKTGETVLYRRYGICKVAAIEERNFFDTEKTYYQLEPVYINKPTKFFVPADADDIDLLIRRVLDETQLKNFVSEAKENMLEWIDDSKKRILHHDELMKTGNVADHVRLVRLLSRHKRRQRAAGKSFLDCDRRILMAAEKLVSDELVYVLGIDRSEISDYLLEGLETN